ncbi:c-type cytochrome [Salipiger abyssi]|uniref:c-type cytochrome n=1 Tax=Salipiger abyssi TaxID=1250539 RepID=UPI000977B18B
MAPRLPALGGIAFVICLSALGYPNRIHAQDAATGERLFRQRCAGCHPTESGRTGAGPSLAGLMGRRAGSVEGARYSPAMRRLEIVWNRGSLDSYLADPSGFVVGTTKRTPIRNAEDRANLIAFLGGL